jgi:membrane protease YdiL (CAAX protease family)
MAIPVILFAVLFPHLGLIPVPFGYVIPVLLVIYWALRQSKENFASLGFSLKRFEARAIWLGAIAAVLLFVFLEYALFPLLNKVITLHKANLEDFKFVRHNPLNYLCILTMGWLVGGVYEEIIFHGFIFNRLERVTGTKYRTLIGFIVTNLIFGWYHVQLGPSGMLNAFFGGCAYHALMLRFNRNMWYATFFHGFFDTIGLSLIFLGYW